MCVLTCHYSLRNIITLFSVVFAGHLFNGTFGPLCIKVEEVLREQNAMCSIQCSFWLVPWESSAEDILARREKHAELDLSEENTLGSKRELEQCVAKESKGI